MKSYNNLEKWLENKNRKIVLAHEKRDRDSMQKNLDKLLKEQNLIMRELHTIDLLTETIDNMQQGEATLPESKFIDFESYRTWITDLERSLNEMAENPSEKLTPEKKEFLGMERSELAGERERLEKHLKETDKIIAKTSVLLIDLNETYCRDLSNGHSIAAVGEALKEKFGNKLEDGYSIGRWKMIKFLENHFQMKRWQSVKLFDLLVDSNLAIYNVEFPGDQVNDLNFFTPDMGEYMDNVGIIDEPVYRYWRINA